MTILGTTFKFGYRYQIVRVFRVENESTPRIGPCLCTADTVNLFRTLYIRRHVGGSRCIRKLPFRSGLVTDLRVLARIFKILTITNLQRQY